MHGIGADLLEKIVHKSLISISYDIVKYLSNIEKRCTELTWRLPDDHCMDSHLKWWWSRLITDTKFERQAKGPSLRDVGYIFHTTCRWRVL